MKRKILIGSFSTLNLIILQEDHSRANFGELLINSFCKVEIFYFSNTDFTLAQ